MKSDQEFYEGFYEERVRTSWLGDLMKVTERLRQHYVSNAVRQFRPRRDRLRLLDVGCGRAQLTPYLSKYGEVLGLDYSHTVVEYCRRKYPDARFEVADVLDEQWGENQSFHVIVSTEVIEHIPADLQERFVKTLWSFLEPGGILLLTTPDRSTADLLKPDPSLDDKEYYRQYEGQPIANLLSRTELAKLIPDGGQVLLERAFSPHVRFRTVDLALKAASMPFKYVPLQRVAESLALPCKSLLIVARKL